MYEARKVCNFVLSRYDAAGFAVTNLRINKLLFFMHIEALRRNPEGLIRNHFEAWQFGPVVRPVFEAFKHHGEKFISAPATYLDYASGQMKPIPYDEISSADAELICRVFEEYSRFTTGQLVSLSHETGAPWDVIYQACLREKSLSPRIPNELLRQHYHVGESKTVNRH